MTRKLLFTFLALFLMVSAQAQRACGTMEHYEYQKAQDPSIEFRQSDIERFTNEFVERNGMNGDRALVTIPVVVHVIHNTTAENISDAQIQTQIDVLNADFRKMNADVALTPSVFQPFAADANIEFCLATVDPTGAVTNGITRTSSTVTAFSTNDAMKFTAQGGRNAWNASQYLNIWVCDISGGILGYAQFPGGSASTDGVVVDYQYFGTIGTATAPFNKGRTATHEVGHWLNLRHIWGDANCGNDLVADTPTQQTSNGGCPAFPRVTCSNGPNGDMFMNYMDYTDDACMYMFSTGQVARMQALFATGGARASLLTSTACGVSNPTCAAPTAATTSGVTASGATFSWTAAAGSTGYNVRYKTAVATTWTTVNTTATTFTVSDLTACTSYNWQVQSVCDATNSSAFTAVASFNTIGCVATYCASAGLSTADEFINNVTVAGINNTSGNNSGYANFTALSGTVVPGGTYTFSGTPGYTATAYTEFWRVWIDYNGDLDFDDAGELAFGNATGSTTAVSGTFTVPATAITGTTRMRVSMKYNAVSTPCESFQFGEVEDYSIIITAAPSCGTPTGLAVSAITTTGATATWDAVAGASSYSVQFKLNTATTWTTATSATTSFNLSALTASTAYNVRVAAVCSGFTGSYSAQVNFTTSAPASCGTPTGLAVSAITTTGATATWAAVSGASSYNVQYKLNTATTWTTVTSTTTSRAITGLVANTLYNVRVATVCSGVVSAYSTAVNFTTAAAACTDAYETNNTSATARSISVNTNIVALINTSTDQDWFRFSTTNSQRNIRIDLTNLPADFDVRLFNPSGVQVGSSANTGTANETIVYNNGPTGTYRVQVIGYNGAFNTTSCYTLRANRSNTSFREIDEELMQEEVAADLSDIVAFPNPTDGKVELRFNAAQNGALTLQVFDVTGREVVNTQMAIVEGQNATIIDLLDMAPGYYTLLLSDGTTRNTIRVIRN